MMCSNTYGGFYLEVEGRKTMIGGENKGLLEINAVRDQGAT